MHAIPKGYIRHHVNYKDDVTQCTSLFCTYTKRLKVEWSQYTDKDNKRLKVSIYPFLQVTNRKHTSHKVNHVKGLS